MGFVVAFQAFIRFYVRSRVQSGFIRLLQGLYEDTALSGFSRCSVGVLSFGLGVQLQVWGSRVYGLGC